MGGLTSTVTVDAPVQQVWEVLSDLESWPTWTPTMTSVRALSGPPDLGADFEVDQPKLPTSVWEVVAWEPPTRFFWVSKAMGVVTEAGHDLAAQGDDATTVTLTLTQSGALAPLVRLLYGRLMREYVETEARSLKDRCERPD